jgi:hypothetical protein
MKYYYLIETTDDEWHSSYKEICETFEEAKSKIMNYSDWYSSYGSCKIRKVDSHFNTLETWRFRKGVLYGN